MLLEDTENYNPIGECQKVLFFSGDIRFREIGIFRGMWRNVCRPPSVPNIRVEEETLRSLKTDSHVHRTLQEPRCVTIAFNLCTMHLQDVHSVSGFFISQPKMLRLQRTCYSRPDLVSVGLGSPTTIRDTCGQMKIFMRFEPTISKAGMGLTASALTVCTRRRGLVAPLCSTCLNVWFQHDGASPDYSQEVCQCLSENYPGLWVGRGREASVSLACALTWLESSRNFYWKSLPISIQSIVENCGVEFNNLQVSYTRNLRTLASFSLADSWVVWPWKWRPFRAPHARK
jgi:hypothetical protein